MKLIQIVKSMSLKNRTIGDEVYCPQCVLRIADQELKVLADYFVRHQACHYRWRLAIAQRTTQTQAQRVH